MPGGHVPCRQGLQTSDDGRRAEIPGEATETCPMYRVREVSREGIIGYLLTNPARRGKRGGGGGGRRMMSYVGATSPGGLG